MAAKKTPHDGRKTFLLKFDKDKFTYASLENVKQVIQFLDPNERQVEYEEEKHSEDDIRYLFHLDKQQRKIFLNLQERGGFSVFGVSSKVNNIHTALRRESKLTRCIDMLFNWLDEIPRKIYTTYDLNDFRDILTIKSNEYSHYKKEHREQRIEEEKFQELRSTIIKQMLTIINQIQLVKVKISRNGFNDEQIQESIDAFRTFLALSETEFYLRKSPIKNWIVCEVSATKLVDFILTRTEIDEDDHLLQFFLSLTLMSGRDFEKSYQEGQDKKELERRKSLKPTKVKGGNVKHKPKGRSKQSNEAYLDLRQKGYKLVQSEWFTGEHLLGIDLSRNFIVQLPKIPYNESIINLDLSNNRLGSLPNSIVNLPNLEVLNLSNNNIRTLPSNLGQLKKLKRLLLSSNRIEQIPSRLGELTQLEVLHLSNNRIKTIPPSLLKLTNLRSSNQGPLQAFWVSNWEESHKTSDLHVQEGPQRCFRAFNSAAKPIQ